jgi:KDO2-lipid IV(A) lauroyltransferase
MKNSFLFNVIYRLYYALLWILTLPPLRVLYIFSTLLFYLNYYIIGYRKKVIFKNLRNSFPNKSEAELEKIAIAFYRHLSDFFIESIKTMHLNKKRMEKKYIYKNPELLDEIYSKGKDVILYSGHYCNWEWTIHLPEYTKYSVLVIYRILKNPFSEKLVKDLRSINGVIPVPMQDIFRTLLEYRKKNERTITWFLGDQRPPKTNKFWTTFLNQETSFHQGGEKIAKKIDAHVVFMDIQKVKRGHYEVTFSVLFDKPKETKDNEITQTYVETLENVIQKTPQYWLWSHKRWKYKKTINT